jgi:hypothetical protein
MKVQWQVSRGQPSPTRGSIKVRDAIDHFTSGGVILSDQTAQNLTQ